jgi:hypothetical protein
MHDLLRFGPGPARDGADTVEYARLDRGPLGD